MLGVQPQKALAQTAVTFSGQEFLARPTDTSITINVIPDSAIELFYEYKKDTEVGYSSTPIITASAAASTNVVISGLAPDTQYDYHMQYRKVGETAWITRAEHSFHTQRALGATFTFVVTSDTHSSMNSPYFTVTNYNKTLSHILADQPDLWVDLGDTPCLDFMDTLQEYQQGYLTYRTRIASVSGDIPVLKALGNHEQEMGWNLDDKADTSQTQPILAHNARRAIFPAPKPDDFYTGNEDASLTYLDGDHLREDYFEWTWGDAQFIVLDPYWYTMKFPQENSTYPFGGEENQAGEAATKGTRWDWSLGIQQHLWLKNVLETSTSKYKFVFIHNVTGGIIPYGRGGTEIAGYFEWGGKNWDGSWGWDAQRPASEGWTLPTHQLLDEYNVSIFFHGHDHFYAKQTLDDVVYQEVPMPGAIDNYSGFRDEQTGTYAPQYPDPADILYYNGAVKFNDSGHIRVTVGPTQALVEYVDMVDGSIITSYTVQPNVPHEDILGDVNNNGEADLVDALIVLSGDASIDIGDYCPINCGDVNGDGFVNSTDALIILTYTAQMTVPFEIGEAGCPLTLTQQPPGCTPQPGTQ
ncbi:MAG TPA: metallophosphoesterase [Anaerolineaceae bacterium]|nr:metallophosphoesterase [Anaerolineaceae bacterium]